MSKPAIRRAKSRGERIPTENSPALWQIRRCVVQKAIPSVSGAKLVLDAYTEHRNVCRSGKWNQSSKVPTRRIRLVLCDFRIGGRLPSGYFARARAALADPHDGHVYRDALLHLVAQRAAPPQDGAGQ